MKKYLITILSLFICSAEAVIINDNLIPAWYTGDRDLLAQFMLACTAANRVCRDEFQNEPDGKLNCYDIKDVNEFNYISAKVNICIRSLQEPIPEISNERIEYEANPVGTASVRG